MPASKGKEKKIINAITQELKTKFDLVIDPASIQVRMFSLGAAGVGVPEDTGIYQVKIGDYFIGQLILDEKSDKITKFTESIAKKINTTRDK